MIPLQKGLQFRRLRDRIGEVQVKFRLKLFHSLLRFSNKNLYHYIPTLSVQFQFQFHTFKKTWLTNGVHSQLFRCLEIPEVKSVFTLLHEMKKWPTSQCRRERRLPAGKFRFAGKPVGKNRVPVFCRAFYESRGVDSTEDSHKPHSKTTAVTEVVEELPKMSRCNAIVPPKKRPFLGWYINR